MNQRLASVLADVFGLRPNQVVPEMTKENVGSWDSLKQMDLVMSLEREYGITLEFPDIIRMNSVGNIVEVLASKGVDFGA
jgi:acyl carrier protein